MRAIIVGDIHVVPNELDDCNALLEHIISVARSQNCFELWLSGDQHHTHSVVQLEVMNWWKYAFKRLRSEGIKTVALVGNHDQHSPGSLMHSMMAYEGTQGLCIVDKPTVRNGVLMLPYYHTEAEFVTACVDYYKGVDGYGNRYTATETVFCHQTFDGSMYENGFLASDGFRANLIPQKQIISGHIHTGQEFDKVWYVGSPRWRSLSDANVERAVWLVEFDARGVILNRQAYSTGDVCRQIKHVVDTEKNPVELPLDLKHQWRVDVKGSPEWCKSRKTELAAAGARVRTFPTQTSISGKVRESEGVSKALQTFLGLYQPKNGTSTEVLEKMVKERLGI